MLKELFEEQRGHIDHFFDELDHAEVERFFEVLRSCRGLVILSGVGKSGLVAEKIAMTLTSTGTRALYLSPTNFLHGDIGMVTSEDVVIFLSKSGETEELLDLVPFIRHREAKILSLVCKQGGRLSRVSDHSVCLPIEKELCPFDLSPTTSTSVQLIFGDVISVALMRSKQFKREQYALNHPAGAIGRKMIMKVSDVMLQGDDLPLASPEDSLADVLPELTGKKSGCLLICDQAGKLVGVFTDGDLRRALQREGEGVLSRKMSEIMTRNALFTTSTLLAQQALEEMQLDPKRWVMVLPVVEEGKVVGLLRMHDLVQAGIT